MNINYNPNGLLDEVMRRQGLKNDAALSIALEVAPPVVSKLRHHRLMVGSSLIVRMLDREIMTLAEIRAFVPSTMVSAQP